MWGLGGGWGQRGFKGVREIERKVRGGEKEESQMEVGGEIRGEGQSVGAIHRKQKTSLSLSFSLLH